MPFVDHPTLHINSMIKYIIIKKNYFLNTTRYVIHQIEILMWFTLLSIIMYIKDIDEIKIIIFRIITILIISITMTSQLKIIHSTLIYLHI